VKTGSKDMGIGKCKGKAWVGLRLRKGRIPVSCDFYGYMQEKVYSFRGNSFWFGDAIARLSALRGGRAGEIECVDLVSGATVKFCDLGV